LKAINTAHYEILLERLRGVRFLSLGISFIALLLDDSGNKIIVDWFIKRGKCARQSRWFEDRSRPETFYKRFFIN
jgi:hypothetical protein